MNGKFENGKYYGHYDFQGTYFKNENTYKNNRDGICYIAEAGFEDSGSDDWSITEEEAREAIEKGGVVTHNSLFAEMKDFLIREFGENKIEDEFVENCCAYVFQTCDWQCCSTLYYETDFEEDLIWYIVEKAKKREDWDSKWSPYCCADFVGENLDNEHKSIDDIIDEFTNLPNN